jgi:predicted nuclease of restriction endonuclease-like (RecB) superfamily
MKRKLPLTSSRYQSFLKELKERIRSAQLRAAGAVNSELVLLYWNIGMDILAKQKLEGWGSKIIEKLAQDLTQSLPETTGFGARNLKYMRAFAEAYPKKEFVQQVVAQLPWGHNIRILELVKSPAEREWYCREAIQNGWTRNVLVHQIESGLYKRQGRAITNFDRTLAAPESELAQELLKDPYNFDFLTLGSNLLERDLERGLIQHLRNLILELGKGFAFVGSQYHLAVGGQDYFLDLLFYHLRLRCYIVIDLKIEEFKPEFAGKMNFYLSSVDDLLRHPQDRSSIGLILCKEKNRIIVEYALRDTHKPMGVAQYKLTEALPDRLKSELPTNEDLASELPVMNLLSLRRRLEEALTRIAKNHRLPLEHLSIAVLLDRLAHKKYLSPKLVTDIQMIVTLLNSSIHGQKIDKKDAEEALRLGEIVMIQLEKHNK